MKPDLHCHSYFSDGAHSTQFLIERAEANKVTHLAITDHDCIDAIAHCSDYAGPLTIIPGVEISCQWQDTELHIIGLGIDTKSSKLASALLEQQRERKRRVEAMSEKFKNIHNVGFMDELCELPCSTLTRTHVADFLVENKYCKNHAQAFKRYLSRKGKIFAPVAWMELANAVNLIREANGFALIAHPSRYPFTRQKLQRLLTEFTAVGGEGIETSYSNLDPQIKRDLNQLAEQFGLWVSCGSDFHSDKNHWTDIGKFAAIPANTKNAIWNHPKWHF